MVKRLVQCGIWVSERGKRNIVAPKTNTRVCPPVKPTGFGHRDCVFLQFDIQAFMKRKKFSYVFSTNNTNILHPFVKHHLGSWTVQGNSKGGNVLGTRHWQPWHTTSKKASTRQDKLNDVRDQLGEFRCFLPNVNILRKSLRYIHPCFDGMNKISYFWTHRMRLIGKCL